MIMNSDPDTAHSLDSAGLESALDRLVTAGTLTRQQADEVVREACDPVAADTPPQPMVPAPRQLPWMALLAEAGGYVGGVFILSAALVLAGPRWEHLGHWARVTYLATPAVALVVAAVALALATAGGWSVQPGNGSPARRRLISVLVLVAAAFSAALGEELSDHNDQVWSIGAFLVVAATGYLLCRGGLLHLATGISLAWFGGMTLFLYGDDHEWWRSSGLGVTLAGTLWLVLSLTGRLRERQLGLAIGAAAVFVGGEILTALDFSPEPGFIVIAVLAVLALTGYVRTQELVLLAAGVVSLAILVPQAITHYAEGQLGAAGGLLITGLSIIGASLFGLRLRHEVATHSGAPS